ncbi:phytanoyl-CoA dioxygenase family protein [Sphingomonas sp. R647]|uniref:phytanoyl-CoA dioxygenase family protein n=1 Tax=Sphingomonas sp. R647 TaxID=2875233 RepID=UPI001CD731DB|nr:phytanoyl-CoA dioxygenase family protein [Sphingomonas sp. R647]MCA1199929.1 phytanoyl-CoA dioxygenase family protein [Sphingomonas sp. R647]
MSSDNRVSFAPGTDRSAAVTAAIGILRRDGVVVLDDLIDPALLATCSAEITARHPDMAEPDRSKYFGPYVGRHTIPLLVDGALADPAILLPKPVAHIATELLAEAFKVDSVGLLVAVPGAPNQTAHRDAWLYPREGLDRLLPPFALAFAVPLVTMDETSGRTAFWRGSHRSGATNAPDTPHDLAPIVHPGSAILWDYRIYHTGLANHGTTPRPVLFTALSREWWVEIEPPEATNYRKLKVSQEVFAGWKPRWQARFSRADILER